MEFNVSVFSFYRKFLRQELTADFRGRAIFFYHCMETNGKE